MARIGVFICHCGKNIAGTVDVKKVKDEIEKYPEGVHAEDYVYLCSDPGPWVKTKPKPKLPPEIDISDQDPKVSVFLCSCAGQLENKTYYDTAMAEGINFMQYDILFAPKISISNNKIFVSFVDPTIGIELSIIDFLLRARAKIRDLFIEETQKEINGVEGLKKLFSSCINCHNCMVACPICFCKECFFNSPAFEYSSQKFEMWSINRGVFMLPNDKILFHLGRLAHMVTSCTACGLCEQACPSDIPLLKLFKTVRYNVQKEFNYEPGRDLEEPLPLATFKEVELEKVVGSGEK